MKNRSIVWLRRDLRIEDHFAFRHADDINSEVFPVFIFDKNILSRFINKKDPRISMIIDRLIFLNKQLEKYGTKIQIFYGNSVEIIKSLVEHTKPTHLIAGAGYEEFDLKRDEEVRSFCKDTGTNFVIENDHLIFSPSKIVKDDGKPYTVFTPFYKKLYNKIDDITIAEYDVKNIPPWEVDIPKTFLLELPKEKILQHIGYSYSPYSPWSAEFTNKDILPFVKNIPSYKESRDFMSIDGTSKFSPYLRFGFISIRACMRAAMKSENNATWVKELIWRDFYASALYNFPECKNTSFMKRYRDLKWNDSKEQWKRFEDGQTGYPIVDAAMRQLKQDGWVHNRSRMIAASFLTKHLLIDWRKGEELYAQYLLDYEMSSNVGGWQWSASTGFDAQPYFRIFNPYLQSKKFDPKGEYIKKYVPELKDLHSKEIHEPKKFQPDIAYPDPIIAHEDARKRALAFYG
jgi:deoxyribodipyrimidine photo-lyase